MIIERGGNPSWVLNAEQVACVRKLDTAWRVRRSVGKRPRICRECGGAILAKTISWDFRFFDYQSRRYTYRGFVHDDPNRCGEIRLENEFMEWEAGRVEDFLANPGDYEPDAV